jgi:hypothetical protein
MARCICSLRAPVATIASPALMHGAVCSALATESRRSLLPGYRPMSLADLARRVGHSGDDKIRWKLVWEFLEEYRWEPVSRQPTLLQNEPALTGDDRWDALFAALAEHLTAQHDLAPPEWAESRVLRKPWFPAELRVQRVDALVRAPAAFRKHGVYLSARDLDAA